MTDKVSGFLEGGFNENFEVTENFEVIISHPDLKAHENGVGHIVLSVPQARRLASLLISAARGAEAPLAKKKEQERIDSLPPVDWNARTLTDGFPVTSMGQAIAETYARKPKFYSGTFCVNCEDGEFVWIDDGTKVGS